MSEQVNYRQQWADGEIEAGTLLDAIDSLQYANIQLAQKFGVAHAEAEALRDENAALRAEQGERQEPFVWMRPDGDEFFELTSEGDYLSFPLYRAPQPGPDVRGLVSADDVRDACANAVSVFTEVTNADQCREVAEYMREVLLAQIARRQEQPQ